MCLVRCLTDKRHKLFGSNKCSGFFFPSLRTARGCHTDFSFVFAADEEETRYICRRWRALTQHSLYNPIFFYLQEKLHLLLFFRTRFPQFFFLSTSAHASQNQPISHTPPLGEQSFDFFFLLLCVSVTLVSHTQFTIIQSTFRI